MDLKKVQKRFSAMESEAQYWVPIWKDLGTFIKPTRGFFDDDIPNQPKKVNSKIILNSHASRAVGILAAGMQSGLTSPSRPWFRLTLKDRALLNFYPVKIWLEQVQDAILSIFARSDMYGTYYSSYEEIAVFGTTSAIILEDYDDAIRSRTFTAGEYFLSINRKGKVNGFGRKYSMTVDQLVKEFGLDNVSEQVKSLYNSNKIDQWVKVCCLIEENDERIAGLVDNKNMLYRAIYWESGVNYKSLRVTGYDEFPVVAARWGTVTSAQIYGQGPSWEALSDVKMFQKEEDKKLQLIEKLVDPPLLLSSDIEETNIIPGGITRYNASLPNAGARALYQVNPDFQSLQYLINQTKEDISKAFYSDLFLMISSLEGSGRTATEIATRQEEKLIMLGRVLSQLQNELLRPSISRTFNLLSRANLIPMPPRELQGMELDIEYISILAQAQKMIGTRAVEQTVGFIGNLAAVKPTAIDNLDEDKTINIYADMLGVPPSMIRSLDDVKQIRNARAQAQQQQSNLQNSLAQVQGAKVLSDTKVGQSNALESILGVGQGNR